LVKYILPNSIDLFLKET